MWPWWIIYFLVPVFVGVIVTEYKNDIFRLLKAAFVHGNVVCDWRCLARGSGRKGVCNAVRAVVNQHQSGIIEPDIFFESISQVITFERQHM